MYNLENARMPETLEMLRRFPQQAYLLVCGDRGIEDLCVFAPTGIFEDCGDGMQEVWKYYKPDAPDSELPWLTQSAFA